MDLPNPDSVCDCSSGSKAANAPKFAALARHVHGHVAHEVALPLDPTPVGHPGLSISRLWRFQPPSRAPHLGTTYSFEQINIYVRSRAATRLRRTTRR
eukprot:4126996-Prymnesium_polylepis.1